MVKLGVVLSCIVAAAWLGIVIYTLRSASRFEPGWSMAPANVGVETIVALVALAAIWSVLLLLRLITRLVRDFRRAPSSERA